MGLVLLSAESLPRPRCLSALMGTSSSDALLARVIKLRICPPPRSPMQSTRNPCSPGLTLLVFLVMLVYRRNEAERSRVERSAARKHRKSKIRGERERGKREGRLKDDEGDDLPIAAEHRGAKRSKGGARSSS